MAKCKIRVTETSKRIIHLNEVETVDNVIRQLREDGTEKDIPNFLGVVMDCIKPYSGNWEYFNIRAEICKNANVPYNYYTDDSGDFDIWVQFYAFNAHDGFFTVGVCLSDIFSIAEDNKQEIRNRMYIREYLEK